MLIFHFNDDRSMTIRMREGHLRLYEMILILLTSDRDSGSSFSSLPSPFALPRNDIRRVDHFMNERISFLRPFFKLRDTSFSVVWEKDLCRLLNVLV